MLEPQEKALFTRYQSYRIESEKALAKAKALEGDIISLMKREGLTSYEVKDKHKVSYSKESVSLKFSQSLLKERYSEIYEECKAPSKTVEHLSYR